MNGFPTTEQRFQQALGEWSDVQAHLMRLYEHAHGTVLELGVRHGVSTTALMAGVEQHGGHVYSVDIDPMCALVFAGHPQWTFINSDSLNNVALSILPASIDMLFIDTGHTYELTLAELRLYGVLMAEGGRIFLHDTDDGSTYPGVRKAIYEYCGLDLQFWLYPDSYGLGEILC